MRRVGVTVRIASLRLLHVTGFIQTISNFKEAGFDRSGPTKSPQKARKTKNEFAFNGSFCIEVCGDGEFERLVVLGIFQNVNNRFGGESVANGIAARPSFTLLRSGARAPEGIAPVGFNLLERDHGQSPSASCPSRCGLFCQPSPSEGCGASMRPCVQPLHLTDRERPVLPGPYWMCFEPQRSGARASDRSQPLCHHAASSPLR